MIVIIILAIALIIFLVVYFKFKKLKLNTCVFVDGAPKTGKDLLCMKIIDKEIRKARFRVNLYNFFHKKKKDMPLIYSNIPLYHKYGYVPLTNEIIHRQERIIDKSVVFIGEYSLFADSRLGLKNTKEDKTINDDLLLFHKLCGHQWNGKLITNSQCVSDCHYANKRTLSNYYYILHSRKGLFHHFLEVVELLNNEDTTTINTNEDIQNRKTYLIMVSKKYYKMYDYRAFEKLYEGLPYAKNVVYLKPNNDLKVKTLTSFNDNMVNIYNKGVEKNEVKKD